MTSERHKNESGRDSRVGCGCTSCSSVVVFGLIFSALGISLGCGITARIPFTDINVSTGGAIGKKELTLDALPEYLQDKVADNANFINQSSTLTVWAAEGMQVTVIGKQQDAPEFKIDVNLVRNPER